MCPGEFGEKVATLPPPDGGSIFRVIEFSPEGPWLDKVRGEQAT